MHKVFVLFDENNKYNYNFKNCIAESVLQQTNYTKLNFSKNETTTACLV